MGLYNIWVREEAVVSLVSSYFVPLRYEQLTSGRTYDKQLPDTALGYVFTPHTDTRRGKKIRLEVSIISSHYRCATISSPQPVAYWGGGLGWLQPLPLAYDLRNKRARKRQNMVFSTKNTKKNSGEGHSPLPRPLPQWGRGIPPPHSLPLGACGTLTPPILKSWVRHWPQRFRFTSSLPVTLVLYRLFLLTY